MKDGKLYFYYGTMASAKTLRLLTTAYNFEENNIEFMVFKPSLHIRDGKSIIKSRVGLERECVGIEPDDNIYEAVKKYNSILESADCKLVEWILIDECQFLTEEQVNQLADIADEMGIRVMCFGLRTDFQSKLFSGSKRLFEIADVIEEVKSRCKCGRKTSINARFDKDDNLVLTGEQIMTSGEIPYKPLCRKCWNKLVKEIKNKKREIIIE